MSLIGNEGLGEDATIPTNLEDWLRSTLGRLGQLARYLGRKSIFQLFLYQHVLDNKKIV